MSKPVTLHLEILDMRAIVYTAALRYGVAYVSRHIDGSVSNSTPISHDVCDALREEFDS